MSPAAAAGPRVQPPLVPLFPLQTVLFPGGLLPLKVFEARYLDLVGRCLREGSGFVVVCIQQGHELRVPGEQLKLEPVGVHAQVLDVDAPQAGLLRVRCQGGARVAISGLQQGEDGLWQAQAGPIVDDPPTPVPPELAPCARALAQAVQTLAAQGQHPISPPLLHGDAGWVANRWCELLPLPLAAKQGLMVLNQPLLRLQLVDEFLRSRGVLGDKT